MKDIQKSMKKKKRRNKHNKSIIVMVYSFFLVFVGLIVYLIHFDIYNADAVINNSYNKRQSVLSNKITRGSILSADGYELVTSVTDSEGNESRYYPYSGMFSHVLGYLNNGGYGLESYAAYYMLTSNQNLADRISAEFSGNKAAGDNIVTTLDYGLQETVYNAIGSNRGAAVVLEASTGKILSMVSKPDFDPNTLADNWSTITAEGADSVLVNRATQGIYPPGSTFKIVTMLEYLRENPDTYTNYSYTCDGTFEIGDNSISCIQTTAHGTEDTLLSFANSCNCSFINMGLTLNINSYRSTSEQLLFNSELPLTMTYRKSQFKLETDDSEWDIAQTSFGQGETLITPIHLAMIGAAIANDGVLMSPYLLDHVESVDETPVKSFEPEKYGALMTEDEAAILQSYMKEVITHSFGWLYGESSYTLAAKSGTAQYGTEGYEHSLFVSYSPVENPEIVVAVVLEGGPQRNTSAAEVAKIIYDYWYQRTPLEN